MALGVKGDSSTEAGAETEIEVQKAPKINPCMAKFLNMQKAGIPLGAIQQAAQVQGVDLKEVNEALGVKDHDAHVAENENVESKLKDKEADSKPSDKPPSDILQGNGCDGNDGEAE